MKTPKYNHSHLPKYLWREDGQRFTKGLDGNYTLDDPSMLGYLVPKWGYDALMSTKVFFETNPKEHKCTSCPNVK